MKEFNLLEGEKIIYETKPLPILKWFFFFTGLIGMFFLFVFLGIIFIPFILIEELLALPLRLIFGLIIFAILIINYLLARNRYNYRHYWVTNKRLIFKHGLLGYSITSVPLERISDIIVSRTFFERIFRFGSVRIESFAGQYTGRYGSEASFQAIPDPEKIQQVVFELVKKKRRDEGLKM